MSTKRRILEDTDDEDDGSDGSPPPAPAADISSRFFTDEEMQKVDKCNIQVNDNKGRYSEESMSRAIAALGDSIEGTGGDSRRAYEKYRVKKEEKVKFFNRDVYSVHGESSNDYHSSPSEESILLELEVIRRSIKGVKAVLFKQKETGGMIVFGPWWNYALKRVLQLSSDEDIDNDSLGDFTAVKIIRSLFSMIKDDLSEVVKPGKLEQLNSMFGVDWVKNIEIARRVIDHCVPSHPLAGELSAAEAHVAGLKGKDKPARVANAEPAAQKNAAAAARATVDPSKQAEIDAKKQSDARKMRMAKMKASNLRRGSSAVAVGVSAAPPQRAVAPYSAGSREPVAQGRENSRPAEPRYGSDAPKQNNLEFGQKPPPENGHVSRKPPPELAANDGRRDPPVQSTRGVQSSAEQISSGSFRGNTSSRTDEGWGRKRDGTASNLNRTKGSWKFSRNTLRHIGPSSSSPGQQGEDTGSRSVGGTSPERALANARDNNHSSSGVHEDHRSGSQGLSNLEHESRGGDHQAYSRSDNLSSQYSDSGSGRSNYRSNDRGRNGGRHEHDRDKDRARYSRSGSRDHDSYSRSDSHGGEHGRDNFGRDDHRPQSGQDRGTSRDRGSSSGYDQGLDHGRDERPQKRFKGPSEMPANGVAAPLNVSAAAPQRVVKGSGRGTDNRPAWMVAQERTSSNRPTGISGNEISSAGQGPSTAVVNASYAAAPVNASIAAPQGFGRGRGGGRGRGTDNRPSWLVEKERAANNGPAGLNNEPVAVPQPAHAVPSDTRHVHAVNPLGPGPTGVSPTRREGGRGRGRGRGSTLPSWMTHPTTNNPTNP